MKITYVVIALAILLLSGCTLSSQFTVAGEYEGQQYAYSVMAK